MTDFIKSFHLQVYHFLPSSRILVCTPSNSAADLICIRLHHSGFLHTASLARVNASCRQDEVLHQGKLTYCTISLATDMPLRQNPEMREKCIQMNWGSARLHRTLRGSAAMPDLV